MSASGSPDDALTVLESAAEAAIDSVVLCKAEPPFEVVHVSRAACALLRQVGSMPRDPVRMPVSDVVPCESVGLGKALLEAMTGGDARDLLLDRTAVPTVGDARMRVRISRIGDHLWLAMRVVPVDTPSARTYSGSDSLTGLGGRAEVRAHLSRALERVAGGGQGFSLVFLDIDEFRRVNLTFGETAADEVLVEIARRLRDAARSAEFVGRLGGDEFVVLWPGAVDRRGVAELHARVLAELERPIALESQWTRLTLSSGAVVIAAPTMADPDSLLADADAAMARSKGRLRGGLVFFEPSMRTPTLRTRVTTAELRRAVGNDELQLYAQPVVDTFTGATAGAEILLRWMHPVWGLLTPGEFLQVAEVSEVADELGAWVMDSSVAIGATWKRRDSLEGFRVGINVSPRQLAVSDVVGEVTSAIERHGADPQDYVIEITESLELASRSRAAEQVQELRDLGLRVAIDDFGSGYANLSHLRDLPVDLIKIDKALVSTRPSEREISILHAVQSIAGAIGADVVMEGVERPEQLHTARECGVRFAQGYLLGLPTPVGPRFPAGQMPIDPVE